MDKERNDNFNTLIEFLRERSSNKRVNLPTSYQYKLEGKNLVLKLGDKGLTGNMHTHSGASAVSF